MTALAPPDLSRPDVEARLRRLREPLLAELREPPRRHRSSMSSRRGAARPRPLRVLAVAAIAVALAVTATVALRGPAPALAVEREDGWLVLRIADVGAGAEALTRELRDAGIRGEVRLLPVAAADVGTWAIISEHADPPGTPRSLVPGSEETVRLNTVRNDRTTLRIPIAEVRESTGYFIFYAGRETHPGEQPMRDGDLRYKP